MARNSALGRREQAELIRVKFERGSYIRLASA